MAASAPVTPMTASAPGAPMFRISFLTASAPMSEISFLTASAPMTASVGAYTTYFYYTYSIKYINFIL